MTCIFSPRFLAGIDYRVSWWRCQAKVHGSIFVHEITHSLYTIIHRLSTTLNMINGSEIAFIFLQEHSVWTYSPGKRTCPSHQSWWTGRECRPLQFVCETDIIIDMTLHFVLALHTLYSSHSTLPVLWGPDLTQLINSRDKMKLTSTSAK